MVFSSYLFIFLFLPLALGIYFATPAKYRNASLAVASYVFYGWTNPWFVLLMFSTTLVDFTNGRMMGKHPGRKRLFLLFSLLFDLGVLGYFKYFNFGIENFNALVSAMGFPEWRYSGFFRVLLPLGISFYTFQSLSYVIDVYRGTAEPVRSFVDYACYVSMFPQLVAGPIIRFTEVASQLRSRTHGWDKFARGVAFFMLGVGKKVLIANPCGKIADCSFSALDLPVPDAWLGMLSYAFQIYFDFSGYSDMAIGLGLMLGFTFPKNFDSPYHSRSIPEYWQRWHISLSSWLKDYLFYSLLRASWFQNLGMNLSLAGRRKLGRILPTTLALLVLWFAVGLWHGASWTFVVFGLYHGFFVILDLVVTELKGKKKGKTKAAEEETVGLWKRLCKPLPIAVTFVISALGHVLFRSDSLADAGHYFASLFGFSFGEPAPGTVIRVLLGNPYYAGVMAVAALVIWTMPQVWDFTKKLTIPKMAWCVAVFLLAVLALSVQSYNPFIYFIF